MARGTPESRRRAAHYPAATDRGQMHGGSGAVAGMAGFPYNRADILLAQRTDEGGLVRTLLSVAVIAVGIVNVCLQHRWHRVLGVVAIVIGLLLCVLIWTH